MPWLISYAVGTLIGVALLALVPEALGELPARPAMLTMAAGILSFFLLEKAVIWRHCHHDEDCHVHSTAASLVIIGDAFHTFVDGAVIAAAVLTSVPLGLTTALAVATHEIPQEVGDVAILLRAGLFADARLHAERARGRRRHPRRGGDGARVEDRAAGRCPTCWPSPPATFCTSRCRT